MSKNLSGKSERKADARSYHRTQMQKENDHPEIKKRRDAVLQKTAVDAS